jgi:hypothetical protein
MTPNTIRVRIPKNEANATPQNVTAISRSQIRIDAEIFGSQRGHVNPK